MERGQLQESYQRYYRPLLLYALSLTGERQEAEDLVQDTFVKAFLSYRDTGSLPCWLTRVLTNQFLDLARRRKWRAEEGEQALLRQRAREDVWEQVVQREDLRRLYQDIGRLPWGQRQVLLDSALLGLSDGEIALAHGLTQDNVRQLRARARKKLREWREEAQ